MAEPVGCGPELLGLPLPHPGGSSLPVHTDQYSGERKEERENSYNTAGVPGAMPKPDYSGAFHLCEPREFPVLLTKSLESGFLTSAEGVLTPRAPSPYPWLALCSAEVCGTHIRLEGRL